MSGGKLCGFALAVLAALVPAVAIAGPASGAGPVRAVFRGVDFDISQGWRGAQSCVVFSRAQVRCYATYAEADASLGYSPAADPQVAALAAVPSCASGWLCLYADTSGQGRRLQFHDEYWQYLSAYDFDRETSSWRNNQGSSDPGALSLYNRTTAYPCVANSYVLSMGSYDNQAYAVWA